MELPTFEYEQQYWQAGIDLIAGVDEVGMGALAGPVTAAAVIWNQKISNDKIQNSNIAIRDSKTMSEKQRNEAAEWIYEHATAWAVGEASVEEVDKLNIRQASHLAMRRAIDALQKAPEMLLIDGRPAQVHPTIPAVNIIDGDALVFSIAAASIVAKVHRDAIMVEIDKKFPMYGLSGNKGYGAKIHMDALKEYGACEHHRTSYAPVAAVLGLII